MFDELFAGGHTTFVALSYGLSFLGLGGLVWFSLTAHARAKRRLAHLEDGE